MMTPTGAVVEHGYWSMQDALIVDSTQNHPILHFQNNRLLNLEKCMDTLGIEPNTSRKR